MRKMISNKLLLACISVITILSLTGCNKDSQSNTSTNTSTSTSTSTSTNNSTSSRSGNSSSSDEKGGSTEGGVEKVKPAPGTGNVQGKVLYNSKPVENVEVKLCEQFNQYVGGCGGKTYTARTDKDGEYVITNVPPKVYEGLIALVPNTNFYVFAATSYGISATKYEVVPDKTLFIKPTNLFKDDLKVVNPKAGSKVSVKNLELKWEAYPDAAYYKFSIYPEDMSVTSPYVDERVDGTSFGIDKPLPKGTYRWQVKAYNGSDVKLAESADDIKFTITDGSAQ